MAKRKNISKLQEELLKVWENSQAAVETRVLTEYKKLLDYVDSRISAVYREFGNNPTITQLREGNRLELIYNDILQKFQELNAAVAPILKQGIEASYKEALNGMATVVEKFTTVDFNPLISEAGIQRIMADNLWLDALKNNDALLLTDVKRTFETVLRANAREEVVSGIATGKSYREVMNEIRQRFNVSATRAKTITFTEMHKAHSAGRLEGVDAAMKAAVDSGLKADKIWRENYAAKEPRPEHIAADGKAADRKTGMFYVGGEHLPAPGLGTDPRNNINCHCTVEFQIDESML